MYVLVTFLPSFARSLPFNSSATGDPACGHSNTEMLSSAFFSELDRTHGKPEERASVTVRARAHGFSHYNGETATKIKAQSIGIRD